LRLVGTTKIAENAFKRCTEMVSLSIPETVTQICEKAFYGCRSLKMFDIPDTVTAIGRSAFVGCSSLSPAVQHKIEVIECDMKAKAAQEKSSAAAKWCRSRII
jgi:hypothetical protein